MRFFCNRSQDLFKRYIDNVSFRAILGLGSWARFSLKRRNDVFMLHVPSHITRVIDVGGVSLWASSVCWDPK